MSDGERTAPQREGTRPRTWVRVILVGSACVALSWALSACESDDGCTDDCGGGGADPLGPVDVTASIPTWSSQVTTVTLSLHGWFDPQGAGDLAGAVSLTTPEGESVPADVTTTLLTENGEPVAAPGVAAGANLVVVAETPDVGWVRLRFQPLGTLRFHATPPDGWWVSYASRPSVRSADRCVNPDGTTTFTVGFSEAVSASLWDGVVVALDGSACAPQPATGVVTSRSYACKISPAPMAVRIEGAPLPLPPGGKAGTTLVAEIVRGTKDSGCLRWTPESLDVAGD